MSSEQLSTRILSEQARIKSDDIRREGTEEEIIGTKLLEYL